MLATDYHEFESGVKIHSQQGVEIPAGGVTTWERETEELLGEVLRSFPAGGCYVNCGAGIGYYPLLVHRLATSATIHAFEPLEKHRQYLRDNLALNGVSDDEICVHEEGISHSDDTLLFFEQNFGSMILHKRRDVFKNRLKLVKVYLRQLLQNSGLRDYGISCTRISVFSMESLCQRVGGHIDLLQTDVQGSEADFLEGGVDTLSARAIHTMLISTHGATLHDRCEKTLTSRGYDVTYSRPGRKDDGIILARANAT